KPRPALSAMRDIASSTAWRPWRVHRRTTGRTSASGGRSTGCAATRVECAAEAAPENHAEVVGRHVDDLRKVQPRYGGTGDNLFQIAYTPLRIAPAQILVKSRVARRKGPPSTSIGTVQVERTSGRQQAAGLLQQRKRRAPGRDVDHVDADDGIRPVDWPRLFHVEGKRRRDIRQAGLIQAGVDRCAMRGLRITRLPHK